MGSAELAFVMTGSVAAHRVIVPVIVATEVIQAPQAACVPRSVADAPGVIAPIKGPLAAVRMGRAMVQVAVRSTATRRSAVK